MVHRVMISDEVEAFNESCATEFSLEKQLSTIDFPFEEVIRPKSVKMSQTKQIVQELNKVKDNLQSPCAVYQLGDIHDDTSSQDKIESKDEDYQINKHESLDVPAGYECKQEDEENEEKRTLLLKKQNGSKSLVPTISKQNGSKNLVSSIESADGCLPHDSREIFIGPAAAPSSLEKQSRMRNIHLTVGRKDAFKMERNMPAMIKGISNLNVKNIERYDTYAISDPLATPSNKVAKSKLRNNKALGSKGGDGDIWIEMIFRHQATGKMQIMFVSKNTAKKVLDEPPSGASKVIYLNESERKMAEKKEKILDEFHQLASVYNDK